MSEMTGASSEKKVAVLGTGSIGMRHISILQGLGVAAIAVPIREGRRSEFEAKGILTAASLSEARSTGAGAVVVATETKRHVSDVLEALELGMHVLCEKPLGSNRDAAAPIHPALKRSDLKLYIAQCLRFDAGLETFRSMFGKVGRLHSVRIESRSYLPDWRPGTDYRRRYSARADEGGVLRDMIHEIDYALWLFGPPSAVYGITRNTGTLGIESDEAAEGLWTTPAGPSISMGLDYLTHKQVRFVRISGDRGEIGYDFISRRIEGNTIGEGELTVDIGGKRDDMYLEQMKEFLEVLDGAVPRNLCSFGEAVNALAVCDAWRRSSESKWEEEVRLWQV